MNYAIFAHGGKQYKISQDEEILLPRMKEAESQKIVFSEVLLAVKDKQVLLGKPHLAGAKVEAKILEHLKGPKIRVATYKARARYRRAMGYRDYLTRVKILRIVLREKQKPTKAKTVKK